MTKAEEVAAQCCSVGHGMMRTCSSCQRFVDLFEELISDMREKCARVAEKYAARRAGLGDRSSRKDVKAYAVGLEAAAHEIAKEIRQIR